MIPPVIRPLEGGRPIVDDGAPCPDHPEFPSKRIIVQGIGPFSQCSECREDFLRWYADHTRRVEPGGPEMLRKPLRPQAELAL